jgi:mannose-1-phosphate guanylyltransferase
MPGSSVAGNGLSEVRSVCRFVEQPTASQAEDLVRQGALWNTSILVFRLQMLWGLMWCVAPTLSMRFMQIADAIDTPRAHDVIDAVYQGVPPVSVSRGILQSVSHWCPSRLAVIRLDEASWSDRGGEHRLLRDLSILEGSLPA